jgi:hypothetical protein
MSEILYKQKYIKYKTKYLNLENELRKQQGGEQYGGEQTKHRNINIYEVTRVLNPLSVPFDSTKDLKENLFNILNKFIPFHFHKSIVWRLVRITHNNTDLAIEQIRHLLNTETIKDKTENDDTLEFKDLVFTEIYETQDLFDLVDPTKDDDNYKIDKLFLLRNDTSILSTMKSNVVQGFVNAKLAVKNKFSSESDDDTQEV